MIHLLYLQPCWLQPSFRQVRDLSRKQQLSELLRASRPSIRTAFALPWAASRTHLELPRARCQESPVRELPRATWPLQSSSDLPQGSFQISFGTCPACNQSIDTPVLPGKLTNSNSGSTPCECATSSNALQTPHSEWFIWTAIWIANSQDWWNEPGISDRKEADFRRSCRSCGLQGSPRHRGLMG